MENWSPEKLDERKSLSPGSSLKILMLCWEYPPNMVGGLSRHVYGLSVQLAELGHEVHVLTVGTQGHALEKGVNVHRVQPLNERDEDFLTWIGGLNLTFAYYAEHLAQTVQFDLIHAHDWLVGTSAICLKEILEIPLLATIHATEHGRNHGIHTEMQHFIHEKERQLIDKSDQIIVCSKFMKVHLIDVFKEKDEKIVIIANGIEPNCSVIDIEEIFPEFSSRRFIFSIGRIVREKGFETIIEAAAIAKERQLDLFFVIAGIGPLLERYRRTIVEKKLENYVTFIGYISEEQRNALINGCQIAVFPSLYEPFGIVALETLLLSKPTIVSNTGGLKGIVSHMQTGLLMTPGDAESLLQQISFLQTNSEEAKKMGLRGKKLVTSLYGWKRIAAETVRIIEDLLLHQIVFKETDKEPSMKKFDKKGVDYDKCNGIERK